MICAIKKCKNKTNISQQTGLCPSCNKCFNEITDRNKSIDDGDSDLANEVSTSQQSIPKVDLKHLVSSFNNLDDHAASSTNTNEILKNMYGLLINIYAKNEQIEQFKMKVTELENKVSFLESKLNSHDEIIPTHLGIAIRHLPLPENDVSELENVRLAIDEMKVTGLNPIMHKGGHRTPATF